MIRNRTNSRTLPRKRPSRARRWWGRITRAHVAALGGVALSLAAASAQVTTAPVGTPGLAAAATQVAPGDTGELPDPNPHVCAGRDPHTGIYHPKRLVVINPCETVTGTVDNVKSEGDGDYHIRLALDAPYKMLINDANIQNQQGDLVLEIPCVNNVTQADAQATCAVIDSRLKLAPPKSGQHISVTGPYVNDTQHGWMEIHPISVLSVIR